MRKSASPLAPDYRNSSATLLSRRTVSRNRTARLAIVSRRSTAEAGR